MAPGSGRLQHNQYMPRRTRGRDAGRGDEPRRSGTRRTGTAGTGAGALSRLIIGEPSLVESPEGPGLAEMRRIQPYQADKTYICPGCNQEIRPGTGHLVIVPLSDPAGRRHWHSPCWEHRADRRPTGR